MASVLVVDDDPAMHSLLNLILRTLQVHVSYASNGFQALEVVAGQRPDLIILDLQMPGLDGMGLLERLGQMPSAASIPVIIYSANAAVALARGCQWPPQVVHVVDKAELRPNGLRDVVRSHLYC